VQEDEEVLKRRKEEEEDQDVDVTGFDDEGGMAPVIVGVSNAEKSADLQWVEDDPDNDTHQYFPPVYPEPLEVLGY
jgi:hypothetical protein